MIKDKKLVGKNVGDSTMIMWRLNGYTGNYFRISFAFNKKINNDDTMCGFK